MSNRSLRYIDEEERMDIYDRLASKWALKVEARMREKQRRQKTNHRALL